MSAPRPERLVAITGMGVKTPVGLGLDAFWDGLCGGRSAGAAITAFDTSDHPVSFACEIHDFDVTSYVSAKEAAQVLPTSGGSLTCLPSIRPPCVPWRQPPP